MQKRQLFGTLSALPYCLRLSWQSSRKYTTVRLLGKIILPVADILGAYVLKYVLDLLSGAWTVPEPSRTLTGLLLLAAVLPLTAAIFRRLVSYAEGLHNNILEQYVRQDLMDKALSADLELFDNPRFYDKFATVRRDSYALTYQIWNVLDCVSASIGFLGTLVVLSSSSPLYGLLMVAAAFPSALVNRKYTKVLYEFSLSQAGTERKKDYLFWLSSTREYAQSVRLYGIGPMLKARYQAIWQEIFSKKRKMACSRMLLTILFELLPHAVILGVTLHISFGVLNGAATIGDYSLYTGLLSQLWSSIILLVEYGTQIYENRLKIENVQSFQQVPRKVISGPLPLESVESIEFDHVRFGYAGMEKPVLEDVSFILRRGEKLALVGVNGAGKSTLIKLLMRFYDVTGGQIRINGRAIREYRLEDLRRCFGVYCQGAPNFGFTLRENVSIGSDEAQTDEKVLAALGKSGADFLMGQAPHGLDTSITRQFEEDGIELSGGQSQKLALARTFYREASAFVLDEPSASLDPEAEEHIFRSLEEFCQGKAVLFTSHRLTNVSIADRIIVLEDGRIIECGTKEELLNQSGRFAELYTYQAEKFK